MTTTTISTRQGAFAGRLGRVNYFLGGVLAFVLLLVPSVVIFIMALVAAFSVSAWWLLLLLLSPAMFLLALWLYISLGVRRFHDFDASGIWVLVYILLGFIPFIQPVLFLALLAIPGTEGSNRYGATPAPGFRLTNAWFGR